VSGLQWVVNVWPLQQNAGKKLSLLVVPFVAMFLPGQRTLPGNTCIKNFFKGSSLFVTVMNLKLLNYIILSN
jgi:hypothetical protein